MTRAQVNRHVNNNRIPNLKQIVPGRDTLVNYSNQLKLKLNPSLNKAMTSRNDYYVHDTSSPLKLDPINLTHRRLNCEPDILKNNNTLSKG